MRKSIVIMLPIFGLGACAGDPQMGTAVTHNMVAQVVDMDPKYAGVPMEGTNGRLSADAYNRYLKGNVKALTKVDGNTRVGGQGGAGDSATAPQ